MGTCSNTSVLTPFAAGLRMISDCEVARIRRVSAPGLAPGHRSISGSRDTSGLARNTR